MENKFKNNHIARLIITMSIPPALSMIIQSLYNIVDSVFVTKYDPKAMEAISLVFPIQNLILALAVGIGVGINTYVSMKLGQQKQKEAESAAMHGVLLSFLHYLLVLILGLCFSTPFIRSFTQDPVIIDYSKTYIHLIVIFSFTTIFQIALEKILQADGKMMLPMISLLTGAVLNVILDPIFIFSLNLGITGAAVATVIGQIASTLLMIYFIISRKNRIRLHIKAFSLQKDTIVAIYRIGIPSFFMNAIPSLMVTLMNYILVGVSKTAVTTFGIYYKLQNFVYMGVSGLSQGTMPLMSYHYGANDQQRLRHILKDTFLFSCSIGLLATVLFLSIPNYLLQLFYDEQAMIASCTSYLRIASIGFSFGCINYIFASYFQSTQKGMASLLVSLFRQMIFLIPLAYIFSFFLEENGIYLAVCIAEITTFLFVAIFFCTTVKHDNHKL